MPDLDIPVFVNRSRIVKMATRSRRGASRPAAALPGSAHHAADGDSESPRRREVLERIANSQIFCAHAISKTLGRAFDDQEPLLDLLARASFYQQAVRVRVVADALATSDNWWLAGIRPGKALRAQEPRPVMRYILGQDVLSTVAPLAQVLVLRRFEGIGGAAPFSQAAASMREIRVEDTFVVDRFDYSSDGGLFELRLRSTTRSLFVCLDYDVFLADQTHRGAHFFDYDEARSPCWPKPKFDWDQFVSGLGPTRLLNARTTANAAFERSLRALMEHVARHRPAGPVARGLFRSPLVHITWGEDRAHYKFIEHMLLKARQGVVQPSHFERLCMVAATWGTDRVPLSALLGTWDYVEEGPYPQKPMKAARHHARLAYASQVAPMAAS